MLAAANTSDDASKTSKGTCKRVEGSPTIVLADGNDGRDNNVGHHVVEVSLDRPLDVSIAKAIADGSFALLTRIDNFTELNNANAPASFRPCAVA